MYQFSTDCLAGLDTMILKITAPPKVPTLIPNRSLHHEMCKIPASKPRMQNTHRETRTPLADKTASNNIASRPPNSTSSMLLHTLSTAGGAHILPLKDAASSRVLYSPDVPYFRPLPPLPSTSTLQLPSFLNFSTRSFTSNAAAQPRRSTSSLPASALHVCSPIASSRLVAVHNKVFEGPQWVPAFHHPNSPYVPWSDPVRRRILSPPPSFPASPDCSSSPFLRNGAVAPEPWTSSTFSLARDKSGKKRLLNSWKNLKNSIRKGVRNVVSCLGKSRTRLRALCIGQDMLSTFDDTTTVAQSNPTSNVMQSTLARSPRDSLSSFVSSDSMTLAAWLAERRATASRVIENTSREMSVEEYELMGSWLDLRRCDAGWVCGVQDCGVHNTDGSPYAASEHLNGLCMAMSFDSANQLWVPRPSPRTPASLFPARPFSARPRSRSLPRLPCQSFNIHSVQEAKPVIPDHAKRCLSRCRELSMPGGWTFG